MAIDYNAINFKNKDVDKFSTRFGNGDPTKHLIKKTTVKPTVKKETAKPVEAAVAKPVEATVNKPVEAAVTPAERYTKKLILSQDPSVAKQQWNLYGPGGKYSEGVDSRGIKNPNK